MTREEKINILYMYTCLGIPVTSRTKDKDVIANYIDATSNEIYIYIYLAKKCSEHST